ncbi:excalibur calcium-binding domain-containing protein [Domibacillus sp. 8LH]|uniref:excalibur calcium-binding domain-containing protein n=1 Tax=Domibacillus sp. 8LH TaxID=3073900 RepID=UPI00316DCB30
MVLSFVISIQITFTKKPLYKEFPLYFNIEKVAPHKEESNKIETILLILNEELEKAKTAAVSEKDSLNSKVATLEEEVSRLTQENEIVTAERDSLTEEVASLNSTITANASSSASVSFDETEIVASPEPSATYEFYDNCSAAQVAGAAPVYAGDPGYGPHLDRGGDGVGCEY